MQEAAGKASQSCRNDQHLTSVLAYAVMTAHVWVALRCVSKAPLLRLFFHATDRTSETMVGSAVLLLVIAQVESCQQDLI